MAKTHQIKSRVTKDGIIIIGYARAPRGRKKLSGQVRLLGEAARDPAAIRKALTDLGLKDKPA